MSVIEKRNQQIPYTLVAGLISICLFIREEFLIIVAKTRECEEFAVSS